MISNKQHQNALRLIELQTKVIEQLIRGEEGMLFRPDAYLDREDGVRLAAQDLVELPLLNDEGELVTEKRGRIFAFDPSRECSVHVHHEERMAEHLGWFSPFDLPVVPEHG